MEVKPLAPQSTRKYKTEEASIAKESVKAKMAIFEGIVVIPLYKLQFMLYKWQTYRLRPRRLCAKVRRPLGNNLSGRRSSSIPFEEARWVSAKSILPQEQTNKQATRSPLMSSES